MKKILFILTVIGILAGNKMDSARFDWSLGKPVVTDDNDNTTHGTRYDWSLGQPTIVRETETVAPSGTNMKINIGDAWKDVEAMQINIGDTWKAVEGAWINIGDAWKVIY